MSLKMVQERLTKTLIGPSVSFRRKALLGRRGHGVLSYLHNSLESIVLVSSKLKLHNKSRGRRGVLRSGGGGGVTSQ